MLQMSSGWERSSGTSSSWGRLALTSVAALSIMFMTAATGAANAETLREALAAAYSSNPKLDAERARLRATDENVTRAESGYRPTVEGSADMGHQNTTTSPEASTSGEANPWGYSISVRQSVFNGFRTTNGVSEAEATVKAGRENLRLVETGMLLEAVAAYMDVVSATAISRIRENNVAVLTEELDAAKTRRSVKEVTRTDVAQAEARRARAASTADLAKSDVKTARAIFERVVGHAPSNVTLPPITIKNLPNTIEEAWRAAEQESPNVGSALYREEAARFAVDKVRGELLPEVNVEASYGHRENLNAFYDQQESATITGRVSVPLYDGGETRARVRQAKEIHVSRIQEIEQARSETQANVTAAWSSLMGQRAKLKSDSVQVEANRIALEGVREEQKVGQRTLLDVLNAEQEFLDSQIDLVTARREVVVGSYKLLAAMGQLSAEKLGLTATVYDPAVHLEEARQNWFGIDITHADGRHEIYDAADTVETTEQPVD
ncbi:MAG: TolC family outer membrane protein [Hyphomicrobium sp.]